jgi:hypothetical protein
MLEKMGQKLGKLIVYMGINSQSRIPFIQKKEAVHAVNVVASMTENEDAMLHISENIVVN